MKLIIIHICLVFLVFGCQETDQLTTAQKHQVMLEPRQVLFNYYEDVNREGLMAEFNYLKQSPDFFWVAPGYNAPLDYDSVRTEVEQNSSLFVLVEFQWDTLQIFPLSNTIANYSGIVKGRMVDTTGVESKVFLIESGTLIKENETWELLHGHTSVMSTMN